VPLDIFLLISAALFIVGGGLHVFCAHEVLEFNRRWAKTSLALLKMLGLSERQMMRISRIWGYIFLAFGLVLLFAGIAVMVSGRVVTRQPHLPGRVSVTDALGNIARTVFEADGRTLASVNANGFATTQVYDANSQHTVFSDLTGSYTSTYDPDGRVSSVINPAGIAAHVILG
jgi:YD repeat-containing protein